MRRPSTSPITLNYGYHAGYPLHDGWHYGTDFAYIPDDVVYAPFDGKVTAKVNNGDDGNAIYMWQGDYFIGLCHMAYFTVKNGDTVTAGQPIGIMGDTGAAEGRHLHFAVQYKGNYIDPETVIDGEEDMKMGPGTVENWYLAGWQRAATPDEHKTWDNAEMDGPDGFFYTGGKNQLEWLWQQIRDRDALIKKLQTEQYVPVTDQLFKKQT